MKPLIFFDLETTGLDTQNDKIIQISLIKIEKDQPEEVLTFLINPQIDISPEATEVHGYTNEMLKDSPLFKDVCDQILSFIEGSDLAGFNSNRFDLPMLESEFSRNGINWNWRSHYHIDVGNLYKRAKPRTLVAAFKDLTGEDMSDAHDAEADVRATIRVLKELSVQNLIMNEDNEPVTGRESLELFSNFDKKRVDLAGKFVYNEEGVIVFSFGKNKDNSVMNHKDFLRWMQSKDFPADTKRYVNHFLKPKSHQ